MAQEINLKMINQQFQSSSSNNDDDYSIKSEVDLSIVDSFDIQRRNHQIGNIPEEEPRFSWGLTRDQIQYQLVVNFYQGQHWMQTQLPELIPHDDLSISENSEVFSNAGSDLTEEADHILAADPIFFFEDEWADAEHSDHEYIDDEDDQSAMTFDSDDDDNDNDDYVIIGYYKGPAPLVGGPNEKSQATVEDQVSIEYKHWAHLLAWRKVNREDIIDDGDHSDYYSDVADFGEE